MGWRVNFGAKATKEFAKLDTQTQQRIYDYARWLETLDDPKQSGHGLVGGLSGFWRYRVGKYRLICAMQDNVLVIEVIRIAKRDEVYG